ncbi:efflux RND transporter permease subunit [bacterium]|nr:efflux RND transporter permease subunit [bacterium]
MDVIRIGEVVEIRQAVAVVGQRNEVTSAAFTPVEQLMAQDERVERFFSVASTFFTGMGVKIKQDMANEDNLTDIEQKIMEIGFMQPGFQYFFATRPSIFQVADKEFSLEVAGPELEQIKKIAQDLQSSMNSISHLLNPGPFAVRSSYSEGVPELQVRLDRHRAVENGLSLSDVALVEESMVAGLQVSDFTISGRDYDLVIKGASERIRSRDDVASLRIQAQGGNFIRLDEIATIVEATGPTSIRHYNRERSIQLTVSTNPKLPTQNALDAAEKQVVEPIQAGLPPGYSVRFGDAADKLRGTLKSLYVQGLLAIVIVYLLMVALFRSFTYPLIILVTVPLAWSGGFLAISFASWITKGVVQFDILGMLGLIILSGIVVNNAILIVHQMQNNQRAGMQPLDALRESARTRLRPIFMSMLTSVFGMLPLALGQGSGSELYRSLGIIVVGGLLVSTVFTLFVVPTILSFVQEAQERRIERQAA